MKLLMIAMLISIISFSACGDKSELPESEISEAEEDSVTGEDDEPMDIEETVDVIMGIPDEASEVVGELNDRITETEKVLGDIQ